MCLHGFPESAFSWRYQLPFLAQLGYRAWAPNLRGYGRSSRPDRVEDYRINHLVADVEALIDAGVYVGMPRDMARTLALQTLFGSTKLVMETGMHPAELKDMVVSPAGTTAEALRVLEDRGVPAAIVSAVDAAYKKSVQLGQG